MFASRNNSLVSLCSQKLDPLRAILSVFDTDGKSYMVVIVDQGNKEIYRKQLTFDMTLNKQIKGELSYEQMNNGRLYRITGNVSESYPIIPDCVTTALEDGRWLLDNKVKMTTNDHSVVAPEALDAINRFRVKSAPMSIHATHLRTFAGAVLYDGVIHTPWSVDMNLIQVSKEEGYRINTWVGFVNQANVEVPEVIDQISMLRRLDNQYLVTNPDGTKTNLYWAQHLESQGVGYSPDTIKGLVAYDGILSQFNDTGAIRSNISDRIVSLVTQITAILLNGSLYSYLREDGMYGVEVLERLSEEVTKDNSPSALLFFLNYLKIEGDELHIVYCGKAYDVYTAKKDYAKRNTTCAVHAAAACAVFSDEQLGKTLGTVFSMFVAYTAIVTSPDAVVQQGEDTLLNWGNGKFCYFVDDFKVNTNILGKMKVLPAVEGSYVVMQVPSPTSHWVCAKDGHVVYDSINKYAFGTDLAGIPGAINPEFASPNSGKYTYIVDRYVFQDKLARDSSGNIIELDNPINLSLVDKDIGGVYNG